MPLEAGLSASALLVVTDADTAIALGSGEVPALGTPRLIALCEEAIIAAAAEHLEEERTTIGTRVDIDHLDASTVGARVEATATLESIEGSLLIFSVAATKGDRNVAEGAVHRAVVDLQHLLNRL
jgi:predicted thioesterase